MSGVFSFVGTGVEPEAGHPDDNLKIVCINVLLRKKQQNPVFHRLLNNVVGVCILYIRYRQHQ